MSKTATVTVTSLRAGRWNDGLVRFLGPQPPYDLTYDDVFMVPAWARHSHHASEDAVLFSFSDRVVQEKLGLWREQRGNA